MIRISDGKIKKILDLREKGYSINEISQKSGVSKTTVFRYAHSVNILPRFKKRWLERRNASKIISDRQWRSALEKSENLIKSLEDRDLILIGLSLYWAEGAKKDFRLSNTDPSMIKTFIYILTGAIASTLSATIGYLIGHFLWDLVGSYIVPNFIAKISFDRISDHFQLYESWTVFLGALTPFPIKALSLAAGVFQLGAISFASYFLMGRLIRFALVGGACLIWGEKLKNFLNRHFHRVLFVIGAKMAVGFLLIWALSQ